jgi:hypothetical protein
LIGYLGCEPNWLKYERYASIIRRLGETTAYEHVVRDVPRFCIYTLAFALQLRKITENISQVIRKALGFTGPKAIRLVELTIAGDGLKRPTGPGRTWLST